MARQVYTSNDLDAEAGDPPTDDPSIPAIWYPDTGGTMLQWDVKNQTWV